MTNDDPAPALLGPAPGSDGAPEAYRVLARKYRPRTFDDLIGQETLVRTLTNAITSGRLANGYMLTGVRGVGKTTTARIIARALNCVGPDGTGGPTPTPCGMCEPCRAIAADRQVDVIEMDAASRTGVEDVREIIDGVRYRPIAARYKIYIIDEVHMLSRNAFNALLKTLEEPPDHTKFIFATTEIRKVPVTVLSRCQRFDLKRVEPDVLMAHLTRIAMAEGSAIEPAAARLLALAADGSVRDGLSLLDQAIALSPGAVAEAAVAGMLGLAEQSLVYDLFEAAMGGGIAEALAVGDKLTRAGGDPLAIAQDLLDLTHRVTRTKLAGAPGDAALESETARARTAGLAERLSVPVLTRAWQILLKGIGEIQQASAPRSALDMVLVRLAYVSDLPSPADLVRQLAHQPAAPGDRPATERGSPEPRGGGAPRSSQATALAEPVAQETTVAIAAPTSFDAVVALFGDKREMVLRHHLMAHVRLVSFAPGRIELQPTEDAPPNLASRVTSLLGEWTGRRWIVSIMGSGGGSTLKDQAAAREASLRARVLADPTIQACLAAFPGATVAKIRPLEAAVAEPVADAQTSEGAGEGGDEELAEG